MALAGTYCPLLRSSLAALQLVDVLREAERAVVGRAALLHVPAGRVRVGRTVGGSGQPRRLAVRRVRLLVAVAGTAACACRPSPSWPDCWWQWPASPPGSPSG